MQKPCNQCKFYRDDVWGGFDEPVNMRCTRVEFYDSVTGEVTHPSTRSARKKCKGLHFEPAQDTTHIGIIFLFLAVILSLLQTVVVISKGA